MLCSTFKVTLLVNHHHSPKISQRGQDSHKDWWMAIMFELDYIHVYHILVQERRFKTETGSKSSLFNSFVCPILLSTNTVYYCDIICDTWQDRFYENSISHMRSKCQMSKCERSQQLSMATNQKNYCTATGSEQRPVSERSMNLDSSVPNTIINS